VIGGVVTSSVIGRQIVRRRHDHDDLQAAVMEYLTWALPHDAVAHHSPNEGKRSLRAQRELKRGGTKKGWPDIEIIWRGKPVFIELKTRGDYLSAAQKELTKRLIYCGADVMACRSIAEVEASLREIGLPLRASVSA